MSIKETVAETEAAVKEVVTAELAKAETLVEGLTEKAEKLAEEITASTNELVQKVTDRVQAESNTLIEKVKGLIAQLQETIHVDTLLADANALLKDVQTNGYQALKSDYSLLRTTLVDNYETLQAKSNLKVFINELIAKLPVKKAS